MSKKPWMPLYIADYLKDTTHLGALESGAYLHLIMDYWQNGRLPDDDRQLARIAKLTDREWKRLRPILQAFFHDGWKHKRIDEEIAHAEQVSSKRRDAANARHQQTPMQDGSKTYANAGAIADTLHTSQRKEEEAPDGATASPSNVYAFESGAIRLNQKDFDLWKASFIHIDVPAELLAMTAWASEQRSWFNAVKGALKNKNQQAKERQEALAKQGGFQWKSGIEGVI